MKRIVEPITYQAVKTTFTHTRKYTILKSGLAKRKKNIKKNKKMKNITNITVRKYYYEVHRINVFIKVDAKAENLSSYIELIMNHILCDIFNKGQFVDVKVWICTEKEEYLGTWYDNNNIYIIPDELHEGISNQLTANKIKHALSISIHGLDNEEMVFSANTGRLCLLGFDEKERQVLRRKIEELEENGQPSDSKPYIDGKKKKRIKRGIYEDYNFEKYNYAELEYKDEDDEDDKDDEDRDEDKEKESMGLESHAEEQPCETPNNKLK